MMESEEWRRVPDWPSYEVSSFGRVRRGDRCLKPWRTKRGRWQVRLWSGNSGQSFNTYRLVALAFLGQPPFLGAEVAHKDDDKDNNAVSNLKWCSHKENCQDRRKNGKAAVGQSNGAYTQPHRRPRGERVGGARLCWEAVATIRTSQESSRALARRFGVSKTAILYCRSERTWREGTTP